ncbi:MAG: primosomal protein N' [Sedimentisphaerales bacterium]|nr:primosomal protein N' [Sedimentisphaerales bacterium]
MAGKEATPSLFAQGAPEAGGGSCGAPTAYSPQSTARHVIRVAVESSGADAEFDYLVPEELWPIEVGRRVEVPFGKSNKLDVGFCVESDVPAERVFGGKGGGGKLKTVRRVVDAEPLLGPQLMELARWISDYYVCPLGQVLSAMVPGAVKRSAGVKRRRYAYLAISGEALDALKGPKKRKLAAILRERQAVSPESAVGLGELTEEADCRLATVKNLADERVIRIVEKRVLTGLPVVPAGFSVAPPPSGVVPGEGGRAALALNEDQRNALDHISRQIDTGRFGVTLLHGVTDSGKTELYIRAIEHVVQKGKAAIVLLPEIALTAQTVQRFIARFERVAVLHSGLSPAQRNHEWQKIKAGEMDVVIGARSAIFAPVGTLGLVVVDEEHEPSYKQDTAPRYHGRDVAIKRVQIAGAHCVLGSATPSLETLHNCQTKRGSFTLVQLPKRVMDLPMPEMRLVDMRDSSLKEHPLDLLSTPLVEHLAQTLAKKEQAILLLNRRGYSNFVFCSSCRHTLQCRNCDASLTFHKSARPVARMATVTGKHMEHGYAMCHYCMAQTLVPHDCPVCGKRMTMIGVGSQRLEEELARRFPQARIARVDSDSMASQDYYQLLEEFGQGDIDILAGTQILAKGLHFPNVTLVGVVSADTCLYLPDFRANERTFQLTSQVAGRAGRSEKKGLVFVQTYFPEQPAVKFAMAQDFDGFVREEMKHRAACDLPPLWRLAIVVLRDQKYEKLGATANTLRQRLDRIIQMEHLPARVRGPMPAVISRIERFHRIQIIVQTLNAGSMRRLFGILRTDRPIRPATKITIDIDPVNLL